MFTGCLTHIPQTGAMIAVATANFVAHRQIYRIPLDLLIAHAPAGIAGSQSEPLRF